MSCPRCDKCKECKHYGRLPTCSICEKYFSLCSNCYQYDKVYSRVLFDDFFISSHREYTHYACDRCYKKHPSIRKNFKKLKKSI